MKQIGYDVRARTLPFHTGEGFGDFSHVALGVNPRCVWVEEVGGASLWGGGGWSGVEGRAAPVLQCSHAIILAAEIIFLRAVTPLYPANQADIIFDITEGNLRDSFDIIKRYEDGMTVGE